MRALLAVLVGLTLAPAAGGAIVFPRFNELGALVAGRPVDVRCATIEEWAADPLGRDSAHGGYTVWDSAGPWYAVLSPRACFGLLLLTVDPVGDAAATANGASWALRETSYGLSVFAHEAGHLSGLRDESEAECAGLRAVPALLTALGVPQGRAARLQVETETWHLGRPAEYRRLC